jgi:NAD(P)-dependent dehydrogenase (short-subunit alcohol dehydrogenase family)
MDRLSGKAAIVTGAGSSGPDLGTGAAISVLLAREGARVCLVDRDADRARQTLELIEKEGGEASVVVADVSIVADCARAVATAAERFDGLDVLVNNVGVTGGSLQPLDEDAYERVLAVNLKSAVAMSGEAAPRMRDGGAIVNVSSIAALASGGLASAYALSKAALIQLSRDLAVTLGRRGIRANTIAPGHLATPLGKASQPTLSERRRRIAPLGIDGDAWDVAWAAVFLVSDEARFVTGVCLPVDGGATATLPLHAVTLLEES